MSLKFLMILFEVFLCSADDLISIPDSDSVEQISKSEYSVKLASDEECAELMPESSSELIRSFTQRFN